MKRFYEDKSFMLSFSVGVIIPTIATLALFGGYEEYGVALFCILPVALGFTSGLLPNSKKGFMGLLAAIAVVFVLLLLTEAEGVICLLMATPILALCMFIGHLIGKLVRRLRRGRKDHLSFSLLPIAFYFLFSFVEQQFTGEPAKVEVQSSVVLKANNLAVYNAIIAVDTVNVKEGVLQQLGLPVPRKCILSKEEIGGTRLCLFEEGNIVEVIEDFEKGVYLKMRVTEFNLKGRPWLTFDKDIYEIEKLSPVTSRITRKTSYWTELKPRFYWEALEELTILAEQDMVFRNLKKHLSQ